MNPKSVLEIRKIALGNVVNPGWDAYVHKIHRYYSKTYHTPLSDVYDMDFAHVLLVYFEDMFGELTDEDWLKVHQQNKEIEAKQNAAAFETGDVSADVEDELWIHEMEKKLKTKDPQKAVEQIIEKTEELIGAAKNLKPSTPESPQNPEEILSSIIKGGES